jgi:hypothetical protein
VGDLPGTPEILGLASEAALHENLLAIRETLPINNHQSYVTSRFSPRRRVLDLDLQLDRERTGDHLVEG